MMTSTSAIASSSDKAADTSTTAAAPCTVTSRISNSTDGQRRLAFSTTSFSASVFRPQIKPIFLGSNGSATFLSSAKSPSLARRVFNSSKRAISSPIPTWRISRAERVSEPFFVYHDALAYITTRAFCGSGETLDKTDL